MNLSYAVCILALAVINAVAAVLCAAKHPASAAVAAVMVLWCVRISADFVRDYRRDP